MLMLLDASLPDQEQQAGTSCHRTLILIPCLTSHSVRLCTVRHASASIPCRGTHVELEMLIVTLVTRSSNSELASSEPFFKENATTKEGRQGEGQNLGGGGGGVVLGVDKGQQHKLVQQS